MKILIVTQHKYPYTKDGKISGGIQYCEYQYIRVLSKLYDVDVFTTSDSDLYDFNCKTIKSSCKSSFEGFEDDCKRKNEEIFNLIEKEKYDLVICHDWTISTHLKISKSSAKSVLIYHHVVPDELGGIAAFSKIDSLYKTYKEGCVTLLPSLSCLNQWKYHTKKYLERYPNNFSNSIDYLNILNDVMFENNYMYPFIVGYEDFDISNEDDGSVVLVSRLDKDKRVKDAFVFCQKNNLDLKLITPKCVTDFQKEMKELYCKFFKREIFENISRKDVIKEMSKSKYVIMSRFTEAAPVTSTEAAMCGLPVIAFLNGNKNYESVYDYNYPPALEVNTSSYSVEINKKNNFTLLDYPLSSKIETKEKAMNKFSENSFLEKLMIMYEKSLNMRQYRDKNSSLEEFF